MTRAGLSGLISVRPNLHFDVHQLLLFPLIPGNPSGLHISAVVVGSSEKHKPAVVEPPAGRPLACAVVVRPVVVVPVWSAELHAVVTAEAVRSRARVVPHVQSVVVSLSVNLERLVLGVDATPVEVEEVHAHLVVTLIGHEEEVVVAEPEVLGDLTEALAVGPPAAVERERGIGAAQDGRPAAGGRVHVAVDRDRAVGVEQRHVVDAACAVPRVVQPTAVCVRETRPGNVVSSAVFLPRVCMCTCVLCVCV